MPLLQLWILRLSDTGCQPNLIRSRGEFVNRSESARIDQMTNLVTKHAEQLGVSATLLSRGGVAPHEIRRSLDGPRHAADPSRGGRHRFAPG